MLIVKFIVTVFDFILCVYVMGVQAFKLQYLITISVLITDVYISVCVN